MRNDGTVKHTPLIWKIGKYIQIIQSKEYSEYLIFRKIITPYN